MAAVWSLYDMSHHIERSSPLRLKPRFPKALWTQHEGAEPAARGEGEQVPPPAGRRDNYSQAEQTHPSTRSSPDRRRAERRAAKANRCEPDCGERTSCGEDVNLSFCEYVATSVGATAGRTRVCVRVERFFFVVVVVDRAAVNKRFSRVSQLPKPAAPCVAPARRDVLRSQLQMFCERRLSLGCC